MRSPSVWGLLLAVGFTWTHLAAAQAPPDAMPKAAAPPVPKQAAPAKKPTAPSVGDGVESLRGASRVRVPPLEANEVVFKSKDGCNFVAAQDEGLSSLWKNSAWPGVCAYGYAMGRDPRQNET
jgi:hypothetical protein